MHTGGADLHWQIVVPSWLPYSKLFEMAQQLGFHNINAFRRVFKEAAGLAPQEYHRAGTSAR